MTLLTPLGLLVALAAVVPVAAWLAAERRTARVRETLGLDPPARTRWTRPAAAAAVPLVLALACAQPVLTREDERTVRTDAAAMVLVDVSRSMQARPAPGEPTRLDRARDLAVRVRDGLSDVPVGLASMTDRTVPLLLPSADPDVFEQVTRRALASESPPPREVNTVASTLAAIGDTAGANLFLPSDKRRVAVVLTDGESRPFAEGEVARALRAANIDLVTMHVGDPDERVFRNGTVEERLYRSDPRAGETLRALAAAAGGTAVGADADAAVGAARAALGDGPTRSVGGERTLVPLAPWLALLGLVPLVVALEPRLRSAKGLLRPRVAKGLLRLQRVSTIDRR
jgi:hypothetical protein